MSTKHFIVKNYLSGIYFSSWYLNFLILIDILIQDIQCKWIRIILMSFNFNLKSYQSALKEHEDIFHFTEYH